MKKSTVFFVALTLIATISGCTGVVGSSEREPSALASQSPSPSPSEPSIDSDGLECEQLESGDAGYCSTTTMYKQTDSDSNALPYSTFQINCPVDPGLSGSFIYAGKDMMDASTTNFNWSPKLNPKIQISLDGGPNFDVKYVTKIGSNNFPDNMLFLKKASSRLLKKLFGHKIMQVWATDVDGNPHQFDFDIDEIEKSVEALEGWGFDCGV